MTDRFDFTNRMSCAPCIRFFLLACVCAEPSGTDRAQVLLGRLWEAARARASELRATDGDTSPVWSATDMMAKALDYTRDQLESPPFDRVEYNLLQLRDAIEALAVHVASGTRCHAATEILLMPIQPPRYTRITQRPGTARGTESDTESDIEKDTM